MMAGLYKPQNGPWNKRKQAVEKLKIVDRNKTVYRSRHLAIFSEEKLKKFNFSAEYLFVLVKCASYVILKILRPV